MNDDSENGKISMDGPLAIGGLVRHLWSDLRALFVFCVRPLQRIRGSRSKVRPGPGVSS
jgi:hypothetical protein